MSLQPCPSCSRHVRADETTCPFCASRLRGKRAAGFLAAALGAAALTGCPGGSGPPNPGRGNAAVYGMPPPATQPAGTPTTPAEGEDPDDAITAEDVQAAEDAKDAKTDGAVAKTDAEGEAEEAVKTDEPERPPAPPYGAAPPPPVQPGDRPRPERSEPGGK